MKHKLKTGHFKPTNMSKYSGTLPIIFRSSWEFRLMHYLDNLPSCIAWGSESVVVNYISPFDNTTHRYYVDFYAVIEDKNKVKNKYYIEVKPYSQTIKPKRNGKKTEEMFQRQAKTYIINICKWNAATRWAKDKGASFIILTEKQLFKQK